MFKKLEGVDQYKDLKWSIKEWHNKSNRDNENKVVNRAMKKLSFLLCNHVYHYEDSLSVWKIGSWWSYFFPAQIQDDVSQRQSRLPSRRIISVSFLFVPLHCLSFFQSVFAEISASMIEYNFVIFLKVLGHFILW